MKEIKLFKNSQSIKNIQYGTTWNYENNEIGLREISSIHMEINKGFVDTKFLDNWKDFRKSHDYLYYIYYHNNHYYYVIKPKGSSKVDKIRYLEKYLPVLKNEIYVDAKGIDNYEEIRDYNSFIIGDEHNSDEYF